MTAEILPAQAGTSLDFRNPLGAPISRPAHQSAPRMEPQEHEITSPTSDENRGRRRTRDDELLDDQDNPVDDGDAPPGSSRKRRRSRKGLDKKFECPHEGCGKSYSRAEHLYRHQLNHNPKQIYHCDFPDCQRSFVRQDLCARHKERHTARGSQLLRKDTFMHNLNPIVTNAMANKNGKLGNSQASPVPNSIGGMAQSPASALGGATPAGSAMSPPLGAAVQHHGNGGASDRAMGGDDWRSNSVSQQMPDQHRRSSTFSAPQRSSSFDTASNSGPQYSPRSSAQGFSAPPLRSQSSVGNGVQNLGMNSPYTSAAGTSQAYNSPAPLTSQLSQSPVTYQGQNQQGVPSNFSSLPPSGFPATNQGSQGSSRNYSMTSSMSMQGVEATGHGERMTAVSEGQILENMTPNSYSMPVFGGEGYSRSPFAMADDFTAWLFNESNLATGHSPVGYPANNMPSVPGSTTFGLQAPYFGYDTTASGYFNQPAPPHQPMSVSSILDTSLPESALSEEKRQQILDLIENRFNESSHAPVKRQKEEFLEGNKDENTHVLSLNMMQTYIGSYWVHFHTQLPILHRPTFSAANCPPLLLVAMMSLGASCLEKSFGQELTTTCAELANFLAWHLRWELFMDADFRPPAKLWVFQALILLECFEKMYSTRPLHERAHIHHATTLTLMRRGSSLIGRSALDSPPSVKDGRNGSVSSTTNAQEEWWRHWISNEATRRAAFAAFVIDSIHATMFGHSAVMVAHEMRLPLPCDEALWSATSAQEVGRVEASLASNGVKPTTFLDGLKKTLSGSAVRTNSFGRTILMAGLLSVSWHMNQRDLQVSSLGASSALGGRDKWRGSLTRAFDFWKQDFDASLSKNGELTNPTAFAYSNGLVDDNVFESRTVLHHLAHMAMHVDIVDCQIYAGAPRLLGRSITPQDYAGAQRRMKELWAPTARARDATFYALRFLSQVLLPHENGSGKIRTGGPVGQGSQSAEQAAGFTYSARDDSLLNRPWALYFATLIVWSYGYALDGPIEPVYQLDSREDMVRDMQGFLRRVGGVRAPDALVKVQDRNACLGMLILLRDMFKRTRWELLHEASNLLQKCIEMLAPGCTY
ncbi:c2h2 finger domain-containing protein [Diplodia corticola]|uniref:C2h2 finger domain-containing protein n=1 Tax=Diplodia corticola TaxID=236234 RepID=A0A1J9RMR8_9PEZI|nr:c2h2 finger domain-containing protein [Diplodia corticola]OJD29807.1 c2h2 finger domain-containing protein [Diplodia corticola]